MNVGDVLRTVEDYEAVPIGGTVDLNGGPNRWHWVRDAVGFYDSSDASNRLSAAYAAKSERVIRSLPDPAPVTPDLNQILDSLHTGDVVTAKIGDHTITGPVTVPGQVILCGSSVLRFAGGGFDSRLTSVEVVSRALPDWADDTVAMIHADTWLFYRTSAGARWESDDRVLRTTEELVQLVQQRRHRVGIVARFADE